MVCTAHTKIHLRINMNNLILLFLFKTLLKGSCKCFRAYFVKLLLINFNNHTYKTSLCQHCYALKNF